MTLMTEPRILSDPEYLRFRELVRVKSGFNVTAARRAELERVILQMSGELELSGSDALYGLLLDEERGRPLQENLVARLTIGETYFFRNRPQFEALERYILPELIARRRATRTLRLWSAGCASGEEPYSLAIVLQRLLPDLADWNILILGTDINRELLERARHGVYRPWSFRDGAEELQPHYFTRLDNLFELAQPIRRLVQFAYLNLVEDVYPSLLTNTHQMDLILCRNVLIYFAEEMTRRVAGRLHQSLADEGWLIVGHAEPSQAVFHQFATRDFPGTVVYQKALAEPALPAGAHHLAFGVAADHASVLGRRSGGLFPKGPKDPSAHAAVGIADSPSALEQGPTRANGSVAAPLAALDPPGPSTAAAQTLWAHGNVVEAVAMLLQLAEAQPGDAQAPCLLAKFYANRLQLAEAEDWIEIALRRAPLMAQAHYLRGLILQEGGRPWEALEALRGCVYVDPRFVLAHFALAGQFAKLGQLQRAQKSLENVARLLSGRARDELIAEGDGLTVGRLLVLAASYQELSDEQR